MSEGGRSNSAVTLCPAASNCGVSVVKTRFRRAGDEGFDFSGLADLGAELGHEQ
jgi:hypothetical protein